MCTLLLAMRKKYLSEINLSNTTFLKILHLLKNQNKLRQAKTKNINELKERWKDKPLHGKYPIRASDSCYSKLVASFVGSEI